VAYVSIPTYLRSITQRYALVAAKCKSCGTVNLPRGVNCAKCAKTLESQPLRLSGRGKIYSFTIISAGGAPPEFSAQQRFSGSYAVAVVELEEGPRIVAQLTDCEFDELRIGLGVEAVFREIYEDDGVIRYGIKFRPARIP
jgi:uncharacterized OB-fold protein